jgi:hypothetical protein
MSTMNVETPVKRERERENLAKKKKKKRERERFLEISITRDLKHCVESKFKTHQPFPSIKWCNGLF